MSLRILAGQITVPLTTTASKRDDHLKQTVKKVRRNLEHESADLVVLPELSSIEYSRQSFDHLKELAEPLDGPSFFNWSAVARDHKTHVAYSFPRKSDKGYHICLAVAGPDGNLIGYYDKLHLAQYGASMEKEYFAAGSRLFVFEIDGYRIAPIICYDIRIPELCRTLTVDHAVDIILHSGAYYRDESFSTWHSFAISRAMENQIYLLSLNRAGENYGGSVFCPPWIDDENPTTAFPKSDEAFVQLMADKEHIKSVRERYSFLGDRLDSYNLPLG